jgi:hypothetical protein
MTDGIFIALCGINVTLGLSIFGFVMAINGKLNKINGSFTEHKKTCNQRFLNIEHREGD